MEKRVTYVANDGEVFLTEQEALDHEKAMTEGKEHFCAYITATVTFRYEVDDWDASSVIETIKECELDFDDIPIHDIDSIDGVSVIDSNGKWTEWGE
jgi:hypothetical protein